jgi:hypothetical protein
MPRGSATLDAEDAEGLRAAATFADESADYIISVKPRVANDRHLLEYRKIATQQAVLLGEQEENSREPENFNDEYLFPDRWSDQLDRIFRYLSYTPKLISEKKVLAHQWNGIRAETILVRLKSIVY